MPQLLLTMLRSMLWCLGYLPWGGAGAGAASQPAHGPLYMLQVPTAAVCISKCLQAGGGVGQNIELCCPGKRTYKAAMLLAAAGCMIWG